MHLHQVQLQIHRSEISIDNNGTFFVTTRSSYRAYRSRISQEDKNSDDDLINDSSEHSLQLLTLSSTLKTMYRIKWPESEGEMSYELLIDDLHERRFGLKNIAQI